MIDEVVCSDWEAWKEWGSPHRGQGGGGREETVTGPWIWRGHPAGRRAPSCLPFLLGSRAKGRASQAQAPR